MIRGGDCEIGGESLGGVRLVLGREDPNIGQGLWYYVAGNVSGAQCLEKTQECEVMSD